MKVQGILSMRRILLTFALVIPPLLSMWHFRPDEIGDWSVLGLLWLSGAVYGKLEHLDEEGHS